MAAHVEHQTPPSETRVIHNAACRNGPFCGSDGGAFNLWRKQLQQRLYAIKQTGRLVGIDLNSRSGNIQRVSFIADFRVGGFVQRELNGALFADRKTIARGAGNLVGELPGHLLRLGCVAADGRASVEFERQTAGIGKRHRLRNNAVILGLKQSGCKHKCK